MNEIQIGLQREPDSLHTVGSLLLLMLLLGYRESFSFKSLRIEADLNGFQKRKKKIEKERKKVSQGNGMNHDSGKGITATLLLLHDTYVGFNS